MSDWIEVRSVNGDGPRCGCGAGNRSALHIVRRWRGGRVDPDGDHFLCAECAVEAVEGLLIARGQPSFGPCARPNEYWHADDCVYCTTRWPKVET